MGRTTGRSPEDTRRLVLDAAAREICRDGIRTSLDAIAQRAGVSKGGLIYHFPNKEALHRALVQQEVDEWRELVEREVDPEERGPGRLIRAYVRASLAPFDGADVRERFRLFAQLSTVPAAVRAAEEDEARWQRELEADGVPQATRVLVVAAADGACGPPLLGSALPDEVRERLKADLLALVDAAVGAPVRAG
ncbi:MULTISPECIES: TetR family transcriptional regulator [Actinosynnema]|uniref:TetR family transcriptional regulator n=1 Tax=Actinosynnema pretiosum TaxID=42197 RepID=A0A290ZAE0_9PSEU|nr:TetR family transcriptional regulator [Actinosynnema pretiosum]ATE55939.1 TetR family transcriptional regulator [Actinosynnema pretiosum]